MNTLFARVVGFIVPQNLANDAARYYRYQLFIAVTLVLLGVIACAQVYSIFVSALPWADIIWTLLFTVPLQVALIAAPLYFRYSGNYLRAVHIVLGAMFVTLVSVVFFLGGPLGGVSVVMSFVVPMFAFVLVGLKSGVVWGVLTYLALMTGGVMDVMGFEFPYIDNTPHAAVGKMIHLNVSFFSIFLMVAFYEISNQRYRKQLEEVARHDDLTKLPNRSAFYAAIETAISEYDESRTPFTLVYIDLDNFKPINDVHGHSAGDQVLRAFAQRLKRSVRNQDFVCRLGGDEFAVLLKGSVDARIAQLVLDRLDRQMNESIDLRNGKSIAISASTGMAFYPDDAASLEAILHAADERMYVRKRETKCQQQAATAC